MPPPALSFPDADVEMEVGGGSSRPAQQGQRVAPQLPPQPAAPAGGWRGAALQPAAAQTPAGEGAPAATASLQEIFVINDDITVEKPIEDYYAELDKRLQGLKSQLGSDADWMPSTYEKYMTGQHQVAGSLQRNVREYYNDFKLLRADTQVRVGGGGRGAVARAARRCSLGHPPVGDLLCSKEPGNC